MNRLFEYYRRTSRFSVAKGKRIVAENAGWGAQPSGGGINTKGKPYFVIDARSMGPDTVLRTDGQAGHTSYLLNAIHMRLLVEAYDSYLCVQERLDNFSCTEQLKEAFSGLQGLETLILILSPLFIDGSDKSRKQLRKLVSDGGLSIDEFVQRLMKLPVVREDR